jgi:hypothetical protein
VTPSHSFLLFCEGPSDHSVAAVIVPKVLVELEDWLDAELITVRGLSDDQPYQAWSGLRAVAAARGIPSRLGFRGRGPDTANAWFALQLAKQRGCTGVILLRDADKTGDSRRADLDSARSAFCSSNPDFRVALGVANTKIECWRLAAYPKGTTFEENLGFDVFTQAEQLVAQDENAKRSAKRVLAAVEAVHGSSQDELVRASTTHLAAQGVRNGLRDFLCEVRCRLAPEVSPRQPSPLEWCDCSAESP